jgi:phosphatidylglycerophosphate synthase
VTGDRRPIAARDSGWVQRLAGWLVRRGASANAISLAGMLAALLAGGGLALAPHLPGAGARLLWLMVAALVQLRLMANLLDGMVAIGRGVASPLGELYNDLPDRVSDTAVLAGLGLAAGQPLLGLWAALAAMTTAYVRVVVRSAGAPSDFRGPMAKPHRMAVVTAAALWCAAAPVSWWAPVQGAALWVLLLGALLTANRRLTAGVRALKGKA